ncbi:hypothetical protein HHK36_011348 [Tetracentron sinense]|uniref:Uncharacterized protein n=1 Tax=Tetracentron sinense TaxID=13715 RepID=A0A835DJT3_TETSI|nr:hypothetical protein HHK36_011348 [Tetracentron sinense]
MPPPPPPSSLTTPPTLPTPPTPTPPSLPHLRLLPLPHYFNSTSTSTSIFMIFSTITSFIFIYANFFPSSIITYAFFFITKESQVDYVSFKPVCECDKPGAVCQDPRFIGGDGITFDFHGAKKTATWVDSVDRLSLVFNGESVFLPEGEGAKWQSTIEPGVSITRSRDTNRVVIEVRGNFKITATVYANLNCDSGLDGRGVVCKR